MSVTPGDTGTEVVVDGVEHLGEDGLPPYPPARPWPRAPEAPDPLWVFGYGSLIWHPGFPYLESRAARVHGHHRALCVWSWEYRGTVSAPGLVLGLGSGGSCTGVAFHVPARERDATLAYLLRRELPSDLYRPGIRSVRLHDGRRVRALTFLADPRHPRYAGDLSVERTLQVVSAARGHRGSNADYVRNTVEHLEELGIPCRRLHRLVDALDRRAR